jgi:hypothetical protein
MIKHAPQPVAASPSIVPSDEQIKQVAYAYTEGDGPAFEFSEESLIAFVRELTTASNAGEAVKGGEA